MAKPKRVTYCVSFTIVELEEVPEKMVKADMKADILAMFDYAKNVKVERA